jgi:hypothetical protein
MITTFHRLATTDPKYENAKHWGQPDAFQGHDHGSRRWE